MLKKLGITALLVAAGIFVASKTKVGSYAEALWDKCKSKAVKQVSMDFEIERIRKDIDRLIPDMRKNLNTLAVEMVAVENLRDDIGKIRGEVEKQKINLRAMNETVREAANRDVPVTPVVFNGTSYSLTRLQERLASDLAACKRCEESLKHKESLLEAKERAVDAAKEQLATIRAQKAELEVALAQLEAEVKTLRVAQAKSKIILDDSRLAQVKDSMNQLRNRLKVEVREAELVGTFVNETTVQEQRPVRTRDEVVRDVDSYLNGTGERVAEKK